MKAVVIALGLAVPLSAQDLVWEHTLEAAKTRAQAEHKMIFLDLWAEWWGPCQALRRQVFPAGVAQAALAGVVPLEVMIERRDGSATAEGKDLARRFNLRAFPTLSLLDAQGNLIRSEVGFLDPEALARFISGS